MRQFTLIFLLLLAASGAWTQVIVEYDMTDLEVSDCDGILYDSGSSDGTYSINEDLIFIVNTGGASISISFLNEICIEDGFDHLYIHDGIGIGAPLIADITGAGFVPPGLQSTGGAITFHFVSDISASYCGFEILWNTIVAPPVPPTFTVPSSPSCDTGTINLLFSEPIGCGWLLTDSITVSSLTNYNVLNASVNCVGESGTTATVNVGPAFTYNCDFSIDLVLAIPDACDSLWYFPLSADFAVNTCGIDATAYSSTSEICQGQCATIGVAVVGCYDYSYAWSNGETTAGPFDVCPTQTTTYTVTITEIQTGIVDTESLTITVSEIEILETGGLLCQSAAPSFLGATPLGGTWSGPGIQDQETGYFVPDSLSGGINVITYSLENGCSANLVYNVIPIQSGNFAASCPGQSPFELVGVPTGGVWTGPFVNANFFDPSTDGVYPLVYSLNGCTDTLQMSVGNIGGQFVADTLCQSNWPDTLVFSPFGGTWTGAGIVDDLYGVFDPSEVAAGTYDLMYTAIGCDQLFTITVKEIDTGTRVRSSCPSQDPYIPYPDFSPVGGNWQGDGIVDQMTGLYDPGSLPEDYWTSLIYYAPNGCTDTIFIYNRTTEIPADTVHLCAIDEGGMLDFDTVGNVPFGGGWTGNGVVDLGDGDYYFEPDLAGVGMHWITYEANGCSDSLMVIIHPDNIAASDLELCSDVAPFIIDPSIFTPSEWIGNGIVDSQSGLFDPTSAEQGANMIYWTTEAGCLDSLQIVVELFQQASIGGLEEGYCFEFQDFELLLFPEDGLLTGSTGATSFNPALAGEGPHTLTYSWSGALCASSVSVETFVLPALEVDLTASDEQICLGSGTVLTASGGGGQPDALLEWAWSDGLFPVNQNTAVPEATQYFYITVNDGCSDPVVDSILITVLPPLQPEVTTSGIDCYGLPGYVSASISPAGNFAVYWDDTLFGSGDQVSAFAGEIVPLVIEDITEGCLFDTLVLVPSYPPITTLFSSSPNLDCIPFAEQPIQFLDFSQNAVAGIWDFGNDDIEPYVLGVSPQVSYPQPGYYTVSLVAENIGGCRDSLSVDICILDPVQIFIPDAFSPNGDGHNDQLFIRGRGLQNVEFEVYDRWGKTVFKTNDPTVGWDGMHGGKDMPSGTYSWYAKAQVSTGEYLELQGDLTLLR